MPDTRRYSMGLRDEHTAITRRRILATALQLFTERGYVGTTLTAIANAAGVSVQTIYNLVGGKPVILKTVYDITMAGDDEDVPIAQRPLMQAVLAAPDPRECLSHYAVMARVLSERALPLTIAMLAQAATGDPDLRQFAETIENERATATRRMAGFLADRFGLRPGLDVSTAADILWTLTSPDLTDRLANRSGWGWDRYQEWIGTAIADLLFGPA